MEFVEKIVIGGAYTTLTDYISTETYLQHNPKVADSLEAFATAAKQWAKEGKHLTYTTIHNDIAEGNFAVTQSEGKLGAPVVYYDMFRLHDGKIVEHWDVIAAIPAHLSHDNGLL